MLLNYREKDTNQGWLLVLLALVSHMPLKSKDKMRSLKQQNSIY